MPVLNLLDLNPYWWYRAKDQAGANGSTVTAITDASGHSYTPSSIAGTTVNTSSVTASGKALRCTGLIQLPNPTTMLAAPSSGLTGLVATSQNYSGAYNGDQLVNGIVENGWASGTPAPTVGAPHWARFGPLSPARVLTSYQVKAAGVANRSPKDWKWQGAQDAAGPWTDLDTQTGYDTRDIAWHSFSFSNTTAYAYYRILITANWGNDMVHLDEIMLNNVPNGGSYGGEVWLVYKLITDGGSAFRWGTSGSENHFTYGGAVYSDFGESVRRAYTSTVTLLNNWRVVRMRTSFLGRHQEWVDNTQQGNYYPVTRGCRTDPALWRSGGAADLSEGFMTRELTDTEASYVYHYLNTEHGLSVAGAVEPPASSPASGFWGALQSFS